jgi:exodeoxyribonuclease VII large subunit
MEGRVAGLVSSKSQLFQGVTGRLNALNPLAILERGYSVSFNEKGESLKASGQLSVGDILRTRFHKGSLVSKVTAITQ